VRILASAEPALAAALAAYQRELHDQVVAKDGRLLELGAPAYLEQMGAIERSSQGRG
jgi:5-(carboxyamino)imidazole ribonucleotide mutase